jgi:hypothetical protein
MNSSGATAIFYGEKEKGLVPITGLLLPHIPGRAMRAAASEKEPMAALRLCLLIMLNMVWML